MKYWIALKEGKVLEQIMVSEGDIPRWSVEGEFTEVEVESFGDLNTQEYSLSKGTWVPSLNFAWNTLKDTRDRLLKESDYPPLFERPVETQEAWRAYRQALRDLPSTVEDPFNIQWPIKPL